MEEEIATRYWCHMCSQTVNPVMEAEIKCPFCRSGFVEEMGEEQDPNDERANNNSLWAPILMELMNGHPRRRNQSVESVQNEAETEADVNWQLQEILRSRRRRSPASNGDDNNQSRDRDRDREGVIVINPFTQTLTFQTSVDPDSVAAGSLGDYFIGPAFEMLLQRLAENDPNRYGTPPARKEAVEALATVKIQETLQCSVCLDNFEIGTEAKQMPCDHSFHGDCLFPWLELHSSCRVCRYQLPADEPKTDVSATTGPNDDNGVSHGNRRGEEEEEEEEENDGSGFSIPWPFSLFSSSQDNNNPSTGSSS